MKYAAFIAALLLIFSFSAALPAAALSDPYSEEYDLSGAGELESSVPEDARGLLRQFGADPKNSDWVSGLSIAKVLNYIFGLFTGGSSAPLTSGGCLLGLILISAALPAVSFGKGEGKTLITTLCSALCISGPVWSSVSAAVSAVRSGSGFMLSFIPVFAGVTALSGGSVTSVSASAMLLGAAEAVGAAAAFAVLPIMGAYLAISICSGISPLISDCGIAEGLKKAAFWIISLITTVFLGVLSIQTAINSAADTLAMKTGKFILGTAVPIAGPALSEAAATVAASVSLLRSSVGIYGIVALAAILLPITVELLLWRAVMAVCSAAAQLFSLPAANKLIKAVDQMLSMLIGVILLVGAMFIISLTVIISAVKTI